MIVSAYEPTTNNTVRWPSGSPLAERKVAVKSALAPELTVCTVGLMTSVVGCLVMANGAVSSEARCVTSPTNAACRVYAPGTAKSGTFTVTSPLAFVIAERLRAPILNLTNLPLSGALLGVVSRALKEAELLYAAEAGGDSNSISVAAGGGGGVSLTKR